MKYVISLLFVLLEKIGFQFRAQAVVLIKDKMGVIHIEMLACQIFDMAQARANIYVQIKIGTGTCMFH